MVRKSVEETLAERVSALVAALVTTDESVACRLQPTPGRVVEMYPGERVAWDDCCPGQLSVRLIDMSPHFDPRAQSIKKGPCSVVYWAVQLEVKVLRCAAVPGNNMTAPSPEQIDADGWQGLNDMQNLLNTIQGFDWVKSIGSWQPQGPEGGCHGGFWTLTTWVDAVPCD